MAAGNWGGTWGNGGPWGGFYGRTGPDFSKYYTPSPLFPDDPVGYSVSGGGSGSKPSKVGQQAPGTDQWTDPLMQRYFGDVDPKDALFWQTKEGMPFAYQRFVSQEAAPDSYYNRWLQNQEGLVTSGFVDESRHNPDLRYIDYIAQHAKDLASRYASLASWQQGQNPGVWFAGRRL